MSLKWADFMVEPQQLSGMTHHLISQGCRIVDGLGFVFLKTKETKLLLAHQLIPHPRSCCSRWKSAPFPWALTINLVRNMQQGFSQLHFPGSLTPHTPKTHFKKKKQFWITFWRMRMRQCMPMCSSAERWLSTRYIFEKCITLNKDGKAFRRSSTRNEQRSKPRCAITRRYLCSEAGAHLIKQPVCPLHKISEVQLVQSAVSAMPLRSCAPDD